MATFGNSDQQDLFEEIEGKVQTFGLFKVLGWLMEIIKYVLEGDYEL